MYEDFGFQIDTNGSMSISLFVPDNGVDPTQYARGGPCRIAAVGIVSDFQSVVSPGAEDWNSTQALPMQKEPHPNGFLWRYQFEERLPDGFYEYDFFLTFQDGSTRTVGDPCCRYGGTSVAHAAFVVGGSPLDCKPIRNRLPIYDLRIYELMIDDFTRASGISAPPVDVVAQKLDYIASLGVNAIEFMPWTAWPDDGQFSWGYNPAYFFSIESLYVFEGTEPTEKLVRLARLVAQCHERDLHVLLDIVLQHASQGPGTTGFPYYWLWQNPQESPFIGAFTTADSFGFLPLDYGNACTNQFVLDVCTYWLSTFKLDGLRFDEVSGYALESQPTRGAPALIASLEGWLQERGLSSVSLVLEDTWGYDAVQHTNLMRANGAWFEPFRSLPFEPFYGFVSTGQLPTTYIRALNSAYQFNYPISPVIYIENHDHASATSIVGGRQNWAQTQPFLIALVTCPGAILIHNGQEFGQVEDIWENDTNAPPQDSRVQSRPLDWSLCDDAIGAQMRGIYRLLLDMRAEHPGLRSPNFYPNTYDQNWTSLSPDGYGIDSGRKLAIYHRWGNDADGNTERFIVVINFAGESQNVTIPFPINGTWIDLINNQQSVEVTDYWLTSYSVPGNWGCVFWIRG